MIAVLANESEYPAVREFFELFKTHWEFYHNGSRCDVLICSTNQCLDRSAKLVLMFGGRRNPSIKTNESRFVHGILVRFSHTKESPSQCMEIVFLNSKEVHSLVDERTREPAAMKLDSQGQAIVRIGFDLFHEVSRLLTRGQPPANAAVATLELHIALIRDLITSHSILLVEIPPSLLSSWIQLYRLSDS